MQQKRSYRRVVLLGIILSALLAAALAYHFVGGGLGRRAPVEQGMIAGASEVHVMIMGVDQRKDDVGRSDTLMIATVDPEKETAALLSIPRDTRVAIEGNGYDKINAAYAYGGHELTKKAVEQLLDVPVDYYVIIDIRAFERIIDALDGIDIDVEKRMYYEDPWDDDGGLIIDIYPGMQHMTGRKAIQYVRYRDMEGDIGRIRRQQKFMRAVLEKAASPGILPKLPQIIEEVRESVKTDMSLSNMLDFVQVIKKVQETGLASAMAPGNPAWYKGVSYWLPDIMKLREMAAAAAGVPFEGETQKRAEADAAQYKKDLPEGFRLDGAETLTDAAGGTEQDAAKKEAPKEPATPAKPQEIKVRVVNSSGITGAGAEVAAVLGQKGFFIQSVETGSRSDRSETTITASGNSTNLFYGMPFPCIIMDGAPKGEAVVNIGRDYLKR